MTHTTGPWRVMQDTSQEPDAMRIIYGGKLERVAIIPDVEFAEQREAIADARLIAAAPDLLAALRCALADLEGALQAHCDSNPHGHDWKAHALSIDEAHAAIAKATGEQLSNL